MLIRFFKALQNITTQYPLKYTLFLNPYFYFFVNVPKNAQRNKKQFKTKVRYENVHVKLVFQNCETFAENYFMNLIFPKMALFYVQNAKCSILSLWKIWFNVSVSQHFLAFFFLKGSKVKRLKGPIRTDKNSFAKIFKFRIRKLRLRTALATLASRKFFEKSTWGAYVVSQRYSV